VSASSPHLSDKRGIMEHLLEWLKNAVERETAKMAKHQAGKTQSDLTAYLAGYANAIDDVRSAING
jgi:esterase/lipase